MSRLVLDTSAWSHFRRGDERVMDRIGRADAVLLPTIVLGELEAAFRAGSRERENFQALEAFLEEPFVSVLPVTQEVARRYGIVHVELRRRGTPISLNDVWIAATTLAAGAQLLTFDRDFSNVSSLDHEVLGQAPT